MVRYAQRQIEYVGVEFFSPRLYLSAKLDLLLNPIELR